MDHTAPVRDSRDTSRLPLRDHRIGADQWPEVVADQRRGRGPEPVRSKAWAITAG
jgi:hypothetical protein